MQYCFSTVYIVVSFYFTHSQGETQENALFYSSNSTLLSRLIQYRYKKSENKKQQNIESCSHLQPADNLLQNSVISSFSRAEERIRQQGIVVRLFFTQNNKHDNGARTTEHSILDFFLRTNREKISFVKIQPTFIHIGHIVQSLGIE